jgi:Putative prokaryotic signal transducing protein
MSTSDKLPDALPDPENLITVGKYLEPLDAQMEKSVLESAGIECFLQGENANSLLGAAFRARLLVHKKDEQAARDILAAATEEFHGDEIDSETVEVEEEECQSDEGDEE